MAEAFSDRSRDTFVSNGAETAPPCAGRALVRLTIPAEHASGYRAFRPDARFVAHLIATATHAPQTRTLQRAALGDVVRTYCRASAREALPVAANGLALSRVA